MANPVSSSNNQTTRIALRIPPQDIKRLDDPHDDNRYAYECQVPVTEATKLEIGTANPRKQDLEKPLSREIRNSLDQAPDVFHLRNRGIWVAARRAEYDNQKQILLLDCQQTTEERYGVVDGGHTKAILSRFLDEKRECPEVRRDAAGSPILKPMPYVNLHIRVGVEDNLEDMAVCLNRSTQLKEYALDDFRGEFDKLKEIFASEKFAGEIGYTENEDKEYDVLDVIQRLTLFCVGIYPNSKDLHPTIAYSSKAKCLQQYVAQKEKYLALRPIMADCFRLVDQIEVMLPVVSGSEKFAKFNFAKKQKPRVPASLKGLRTDVGGEKWDLSCNVSEAVVYPLSASLRVLVRAKADGTVMGWRQDPVRFFRQHGRELFDDVRGCYDDAGKSLTTLGKKTEFWAKLHKTAYVALHPED